MKITDEEWQTLGPLCLSNVAERLLTLRTPCLASDLDRLVALLFTRANNPADYYTPAVEDARHDLKLLAGLS